MPKDFPLGVRVLHALRRNPHVDVTTGGCWIAADTLSNRPLHRVDCLGDYHPSLAEGEPPARPPIKSSAEAESFQERTQTQRLSRNKPTRPTNVDPTLPMELAPPSSLGGAPCIRTQCLN